MNTANRTIDQRRSILSIWSLLACFFIVAASVAMTAQWAQAAPGGGGGKIPGGAKITGTVTNSLTDAGVAGATVTMKVVNNPTTITMVTDANGEYSNGKGVKVPISTYNITTSAPGYKDDVQEFSTLKGQNTYNVALEPVAPVDIDASVTDSAVPGAVLNATGSYMINDGSTYVSSGWSWGGEGVEPVISDGSDTPTVTLGSADDYAAHLIHVLEEPPVEELPPDLVLQPINQIQKGLQDRNQVVAINPAAHEHAAAVPLIYTVVTSSGTYTAEVDVTVELPWGVSTGVRTVPVNSPVLLYAKDDGGYNWTINSAPNGSAAALTSETTQTPWFTPDVVGTYEIQETNSGAIIEVHAGRYHGVIDPILTLNSVNFGDGRPVADPSCTGCHMVGGAAPPNFDTWRNTGHAEAFYRGYHHQQPLR